MSNTNFITEQSNLNPFTLGSTYVGSSSNSASCKTIKIDSTHFAIFYCEASLGYIKIGTISNGNEISYGSAYNIPSSSTNFQICLLDSTHIAMSWVGALTGQACIGIIANGNELTFGDIYTFNNTWTSFNSIITLDSTHIAISFKDVGNTNKGTSIIGVISSETVITFGSEYLFNNAVTYNLSSVMIDSTHFAVAFGDNGDSNKGHCIIGTVSNDDDIAFGSEYTFETNAIPNLANTISMALIDSTHILICYADTTNNYGNAVIATISLVDHLAYGTIHVFRNDGVTTIESLSCSLIDSTHFIVVTNSFTPISIIGTINTNIYWEDSIPVGAFSFYYINVCVLDSLHFLFTYADTNNSDRLTATIGTVNHSIDLDSLLDPIKSGLTQTNDINYKKAGATIDTLYMRNDHTNLGATLTALIGAGRTLPTYNYKTTGKEICGKDGIVASTLMLKGYAAGTTTRVAYTTGTYNQIICNPKKIINVVVIGAGGGGGHGGTLSSTGGGGGGGAGGIISAQLECPIYGNINLTISVGTGGGNDADGNNSSITYIYNVTTYTIAGLGGKKGVANDSGGAGGNTGGYTLNWASDVAAVISNSVNSSTTLGKGGTGGGGSTPSNGANGASLTTDVHLYSLIGNGSENGGKGYHYIDQKVAGSGYATISLTVIAGGTGGTAYNSGYPDYSKGGGGGGGGGGQSNNITSVAGHGGDTITSASGVGCGGGGGRGYGSQSGSSGAAGQVILFF